MTSCLRSGTSSHFWNGIWKELTPYASTGGRIGEAIESSSIETECIAEALVEMFSRVGVPDEMITDCGSKFTSEVMKEVSRLLFSSS